MNSERTILVVDDEEMLRNAIAYFIKRAGYNVVTAENGRQAYEIVCQGNIDVIISDVRMPGGDGIELIKNVKGRDPALPFIIFITAYADLTNEEAFNLGAHAILSKPFRKDVLLSYLAQIFGQGIGPHTEQSTIKLKGNLDMESLGRGGFCFMAKNIGSVPLDVLCSFEIEFPLFTLRGQGAIRWSRYVTDGKLLGVEMLILEDNGKEIYGEWKQKVNPVPHIPLLKAG